MGEPALHLGFLPGAGTGTVVGLPDAVPNDFFQPIEVGRTQDTSVVTRRAGPPTGHNTDAEVERVVLGTALFCAVLGHCALLFPNLYPEVAVAKAGQRLGLLGNQRLEITPEPVQGLHRYAR